MEHSEENMEKALQSLVRAFHDDPILSYLSTNPQYRDKFTYYLHRFNLYARRQNITHREDYKSVALWLRLPEEDIGLTTAIANGGLGCLWNIDLLKLKAALYAFLYDEQSRKKHMADCTYFYYLAILGTDPDSQGKGLASQLISEVTSKADAEGVPCYLETANEKAKALYQKHGFTVVEEFRAASDAPIIWHMRRNPVNPEAKQQTK